MDFLAAGFHRDAALLGVIETIFARFQIPLPPGRDHFQFRRDGLVGKFKADLIIALAGAAMRDRVCAFAQRNFHLVLGDHWPSERSSEQILVLVDCARLERRKYVTGEKFLAQVFDDHLAGAGVIGLLHDCFDVIFLPDIADHGNDVVVVILFQPRNDDGGIESTGIGENDFLRHEHS